MTFTTQLAFLVWQDGRCERRADDTLTTAPLTVIATPDLDRAEASRLLRRLADELEQSGKEPTR